MTDDQLDARLARIETALMALADPDRKPTPDAIRWYLGVGEGTDPPRAEIVFDADSTGAIDVTEQWQDAIDRAGAAGSVTPQEPRLDADAR